MKTTIYCRISSLGQADGVSLDAQLDECKRTLAANKVSDPVFIQEVCSAYESTPPMLQIVTRTRNHRVVFYAVDRFSRNVLNGVKNATLMLKNKCELIFIRNRLVVRNTEGPEWLRLVQLLTQAEAESKAISARVTGAIAYLKRNGYHHSGHVPFGFNAVQDDEKPARKRLRVNAEEDHVMKFIVLCRTRGAKVSRINKELATIAPGVTQNPIVLEWTDKGVTKKLKELKYEMSYEDIAYFLNEWGLSYRGKTWTIESVSSVYQRFLKRKRESDAPIDELAEQMSFGFDISSDEDDSDEDDSDEDDSDEDYSDEDDSDEDDSDEDDSSMDGGAQYHSDKVKVDQNGWQIPPVMFGSNPFATPPRRSAPMSSPMAPRKKKASAKRAKRE